MWHESIAYQIYPKSFMDSNGDGIGDLQGIISKLDYLQDLGIDIIWLSPVYPSPFADEGYDISDYYGVDSRFGTLADMDNLIAECKKRGMKILLDLVASHCSDEHEWFQSVLRDPENSPYRDYFYIVDKIQNGKLPTNWRSYFGGSVWEPLGDTDKLYLHSFHKKQPDLNWENAAVREEIRKNVDWWLSRGISGFRIDAIINIKKALPFKDYPVDGTDGLSDIGNMLADAKGVEEFLLGLRDGAFAPHDAFTVGEVFNVGMDRIEEWIGKDGYFTTMFDFSGAIFGGLGDWYKKKKITPEDYKDCIFGVHEAVSESCFLSNIIENHDEPRGVNYYLPEGEITLAGKKMLAGLYFLLRGIPFIYQGQELGMENTVFESYDNIEDCSSKNEYHAAIRAGLSEDEAMNAIRRMSRDNARTPMQWDDSENAGFSTGAPWLAVNPNYKEINAASQIVDADSVLSFYKNLIGLRKNADYRDTLVYGKVEPYLRGQRNLFAYKRVGETTLLTLLVAGNFQKGPQKMRLPEECASMECPRVILNNYDDIDISGEAIMLKGYQFIVILV